MTKINEITTLDKFLEFQDTKLIDGVLYSDLLPILKEISKNDVDDKLRAYLKNLIADYELYLKYKDRVLAVLREPSERAEIFDELIVSIHKEIGKKKLYRILCLLKADITLTDEPEIIEDILLDTLNGLSGFCNKDDILFPNEPNAC